MNMSCPAIYPLQYNIKNETYRKVIVFDTETTGLLQFSKTKPDELLPDMNIQPYLTQISCIVYDLQNERTTDISNYYVRIPRDITISKEATEITGITREILDEKGHDLIDVLCHFVYAYLDCDMAVCHNWFFDKSLIMLELTRNKKKLEEKCGLHITTIMSIFHPDYMLKHGIYNYCTMLEGTELCAIYKKKKNGENYKNAKYPKLVELYFRLFNEQPEGDMHNSLFDVVACLRCFLKMRIGIEIPRPRLNRILTMCHTSNK